MSGSALIYAVITALLGGVGLGIKAWFDRRAVRAKAQLDDTTGVIAVAAAARELLNPLRLELKQVREEHVVEMEAQRQKVHAVRAEMQVEVDELKEELAGCRVEAQQLRGELAMARIEADELRRERETDRATIRGLQRQLRAQ